MVRRDPIVRTAPVPLVPLVGLSLCWPLVVGGPCYPLHLCGLEASEGAASLLGLYAGELMVACALVAAHADRWCRMPARWVGAAAACAEGLAAGALCAVDPAASGIGGIVGLEVAMGVLALGAVVLFACWTTWLYAADPRRALGWTACSFVLFACAELVDALLPVRMVPPTVVLPWLLAFCALARPAVGECCANADRADGAPPCRGVALVLAALGCCCLGVGWAGDVLYGAATPPAAVGGFEGVAVRRVVLRCACIAVFAPVAVALVRRANPTVVLGHALVGIAVLLVAEILSAPILLQAGSASADLPGVMIATNCEVFVWLAMLGALSGTKQDLVRAVALYLGAVVALPRACVAAASGAYALVPGSTLSFALAAAVASGVVAAAAAMLVACRGGRLAARRDEARAAGAAVTHADGLQLPDACPVGRCAPIAQPIGPGPAAPGRAAVPGLADSESAPVVDFVSAYGFSRREEEVFGLVSRGYTARRIAETLYVSESTVQTHIRRIYAKMGVHSKQELIEVLERQRCSSAIACDAAVGRR